MPRYPKGQSDAEYYVRLKKPRKRKDGRVCWYKKVAGSTTSTSKFLALVHLDHPDKTVAELRAMLCDPAQFVYAPEAVAVLDAHIAAGYADMVPNWRY